MAHLGEDRVRRAQTRRAGQRRTPVAPRR